MSTLGLMLSLFMTLVFTSCQVKDSSSDNGLYSGHAPTTNKFTLQTPASKTFSVGETITLVTSFPFDIVADTSGGSPRLRLTVGGSTVYATSVPSSDPTKLVFEYTFLAGQNDTDGITVNSLETNGSVLQFDKDGVMTNCNVGTVSSKTFSGVKVDTTGPTVTGFALTNSASPTPLGVGKTLKFSMTFSEKVYLTNTTPEFDISFDSGTGTAIYKSGHGTNTLYFEYVITSGVTDANGYNDFSALDIGSGSVTDIVGNNANLTFTTFEAAVRAYSAGVIVGGAYPAVVNVTFPANGIYSVAQDLDFVFEFDREVNVVGNPYLELTVSGSSPSSRQAQYIGGTGTNFITFRYATVPGDIDADGITVASSINDNSNTADIRDASTPFNDFLTPGFNAYTVPNTTGIILNAIQPQAISVTRNVDITNAAWGTPVDNVWNIGQVLSITVGFNTPVKIDQTLGNPRLPLTIGTDTVYAPYVSGSGQANLIFQYTILEGQLDTDGTIAVGSIDLNGGNITDLLETNILVGLPVTGINNTRVDGIRPTLTNVVPPDDTVVYSNVAPYTRNQLVFTANWSEAVHYQTNGTISMAVNGTARNLQNTNNDSIAITSTPTTTFPTNIDVTGLTVGSSITGAVITDQAGNTALATTFTSPDVSSIQVDTLPPTISFIDEISTSGTYKLNETMDFNVTFSEAVEITRNGTYPRIQMNVGGNTARYMTATTNSATLETNHTYRYTVGTGHNDIDGVSSVNVHQNNGTTQFARDKGRNQVSAAINKNFPNHLVDTTAPTFTVARSPNGTYEVGDQLEFRLTYGETVIVDDNGGTNKPFIPVTIGSNVRDFVYDTIVGNTLYFRYTLQASDFDPDGLPTSISAFDLNGATITDAAGNESVEDFPTAQNLSNIFVMYPNVDVWFKTNSTNLAKTPAGMTYSATGTLDNCGSANNCRRMNTGSLTASSLNGVKTLFLAIKTPAVLDSPEQNLMGSDIILEEDLVAGFYTIKSPGATVTGATSLNLNDVYVLQFDYGNKNFNGVMMDSTFEGSLGEVIAIRGNLTPTQKTSIRNYLQGKFP